MSQSLFTRFHYSKTFGYWTRDNYGKAFEMWLSENEQYRLGFIVRGEHIFVSKEQVTELIPMLQKFVETGRLE